MITVCRAGRPPGTVSAVAQTEVDTLEEIDRAGEVLGNERLMLFTDAVIAIAITLLALDLKAPAATENADFWHEVVRDQSEYWAFLISFLVIWAHWGGHRRVFSTVTRFDKRLSYLNGVWLLLIVIMPFATKVLNGDGAFQSRFGLYAAIQTVTSLVFMAMAWHVRRAGLYRDGVPPERFTGTVIRSAVLAVAFAVSIPISFATHWAYACWAVAPLATGVVLRLRKR
jgi:uncharacterized membrane protein